MIIKHLEQKDNKLKSISLNGFSVKAYLNQDEAGGTQYGSSKLDFSKATIKITLIRDGKDYLICQDNLKILGLASALNSRGQLAFYQNNDHFTKLAAGKSLCSFNLHLGGIINVRGSDEIIIEVKANEGLFADGYLSSSFIEIKPNKAVGYEGYIPNIKSYAIATNESSNTYNIGDNVIKLVALNFDKNDFMTPVISQLSFTSDRLMDSYSYGDLVNSKEASFARLPSNLSAESSTIFESDQSFEIIGFGTQFNGVVLDVQFNAENVAAAKNYFVAWTYKTDMALINRAEQLMSKHQDSAIERIASSGL